MPKEFYRLDGDVETQINIREVKKGDLVIVIDEDGVPETLRPGWMHPWLARSDAKQYEGGEWGFERAVPIDRIH